MFQVFNTLYQHCELEYSPNQKSNNKRLATSAFKNDAFVCWKVEGYEQLVAGGSLKQEAMSKRNKASNEISKITSYFIIGQYPIIY